MKQQRTKRKEKTIWNHRMNRWKSKKKRSCDHCALPSSSDGITPIVTNSNFVFSLSLLFLCVSVCVCYSFAVFFLSSNRRLKRRRLTGAAAAAISPHRSYAWNYQWPHIARVIVSNPLCFFSCQAADNVFLGTIRIRYFHSNGRSVDGRRWETHFDRSQTALRRCPQVALNVHLNLFEVVQKRCSERCTEYGNDLWPNCSGAALQLSHLS